MQFKDFNSLWYTAYNWRLDARGDAEWAAFVENPKCYDRGIAETLAEFSREYIKAKESGNGKYKDRIPTLAEFKHRYFNTLPERKLKWDAERGNMKLDGRCLVCGGGGKVFALAPCVGDIDRKFAPEDWRTVEKKRMYWGVEIYPCPLCLEGQYHGDHTLRNRVMENCVPEFVPADHKANTYGVPMGGDQLIKWSLADRFGVSVDSVDESDASRRCGSFHRMGGFDVDSSDDLERQFPLTLEEEVSQAERQMQGVM